VKLGALGLVALLACAESPTFSIAPLSIEDCRAHCVSSVEVELDGVKSTHRCGLPIELGEITPGTHRVVITSTAGYGLRAEASFEVVDRPGELDLRFSPSGRPTITSIEPETSENLGDGEVAITIRGTNFGVLGPSAKVRIAGEAAPIVGWSESEIVIRGKRGGEVVVEQCRVESASALLSLRAATVREVEWSLPGCDVPRMIAMAGLEQKPGVLFGLVNCNSPCSAARIVRFESERPTLLEELASLDACGVDVAAASETAVFAATATGLSVCSGAPLACTTRSGAGAYESLTRVGAEAIAALVRPAASQRPILRYEGLDDAASAEVLANSNAEFRDIEGRYVFGLGAGGEARVLRWSGELTDSSTKSAAYNGCNRPRALTRFRGPGNAERTIIACGGNRVLLRVGEYTGNTFSYIGADPSFVDPPLPIDLAVDENTELLWMWTSAGVTFVELDRLQLRGQLALSPEVYGARLARASGSDRFFLGGPGEGRLTMITIE
jgi:hypothetical protein